MNSTLLEKTTSAKLNDEKYLRKAQERIIICLQQVFPPDSDFSSLQKFFREDQNLSQAEISYELIQYLVDAVKNHFIHISNYRMLEQQMQKLEASIRKHLKIQQQMKIYIQYLEENKKSTKNQKEQNTCNILKQQIDKIKNEKFQLVNQILKLKEQNKILNRQIEKKDNQIGHYHHLLKGRKKTHEAPFAFGNSNFQFNNSIIKEQDSKANIYRDIKKIKENMLNTRPNHWKENGRGKVEIQRVRRNYSNTSKHISYNSRTQGERMNSQNKLKYDNRNNAISMNTTIEEPKKHMISFSNEKDNNSLSIRKNILDQRNSSQIRQPKKKKLWQKSQLEPPTNRYDMIDKQPIFEKKDQFIVKDTKKSYKYMKTKSSDEDLKNYQPTVHFLKNNLMKNHQYLPKNY